jgi:carbamoyl-phosphate synthase large subunit
MDRPIITTVQQLAAAVQGIEAQMNGPVQVKSLQAHARDLDLYRAGPAPDAGAPARPVTAGEEA